MTQAAFVAFGPQALVPPPYRCSGTRLWAFLAEADEGRLRDLCRRVFADPTGGQEGWEPVGRHVVLTFGRIATITSLAPGYAGEGSISEGQACIWVPVRRGDRLAVFVPFLVVDNPMSLVAGRDVFGYAKGAGWISLPGDAGAGADTIEVDVYGGNFGPAEVRGRRALVRVQRREPGEEPEATPSAGTDLAGAWHLLATATGLPRPGPADGGAPAPSAAGGRVRVPQVFLKQVLDITGEGVALQQVGEAPLEIEHFAGHPLVHRWQLSVEALDSHPIAAELGLTSQTLYGGFVVDRLDFLLAAGTVTWPPATVASAPPAAPATTDTAPAAAAGADPVQEAERRVAAVRDDPEGRYRLAQELYEARPLGGADAAYGRGELAFMRWEVDRGVLDPVHGSAWWRAVNEDLLTEAATATALADAAPTDLDRPSPADEPSRPGVEAWLTFFRRPSPASWYCAHNASVVGGYLRHADLAAREEAAELVLVNMVLARVLYAQLLATDPQRALGHLVHLARFLGDPRTDAVGVVVDLPDFYPRHYPLNAHDVRRVEHRDRSPVAAVTDLVDDDIITRQLSALFAWGADVLGQPRLADLVQGGLSDYPWPVAPPADRAGPPTRAARHPMEASRLLRDLVAGVVGERPAPAPS